jgi:uroporphyrinogen III methyltransferase/synthase
VVEISRLYYLVEIVAGPNTSLYSPNCQTDRILYNDCNEGLSAKGRTEIMSNGKIYLVGAGPGDEGLITLRAVELLQTAQCVIYDRLVNPTLLRYAPADAELIDVGKRPGQPAAAGKHSVKQAQINELLIKKAGEGKTVVRLKGGDPCVFGRAAQELKALTQAGIEFEIVPGVTAGIAAAAYAGIVLTDRDYSSQLIFVTGREAEDKNESNINWDLLGRFNGTIVFYMAVGNLGLIAERLMANGKVAETPAMVVADATLPTQRVIEGPLSEIASKAVKADIKPPAVIIVGQAAEGERILNWFMKKPLFGLRIVVTRDARGNSELASKIARRAALPVVFTTIRIKPLTESNQFVTAVGELAGCDWIIFSSANGIRFCFEGLSKLGRDARAFGKAKIACMGSASAGLLEQFGIKADFVPTVFTSVQLARQLAAKVNLRDKKILLFSSAITSGELADELKSFGASVNEVSVYTTVPAENDASWLIEEIKLGRIDWITFTSPSTVRCFFDQITPSLVNSSRAKVASIGPVTSAELSRLGVRLDLEAKEHTTDGMIKAVEDFAQRAPKRKGEIKN